MDRAGSGGTLGALLGGLAGAAVGNLTQPSKPLIVDWNKFEEDEADQTAFDWVLNAKQDVIKIPALYAVLQIATDHDDRMTLGFWGRSDRVRERSKKIGELVESEKKKPDFAGRVFESSDPEFDLLIAEVKRDNGVLAFHHDMLDVARDNLEKAVAIKAKDPTALYYYAKILQATARNDAERSKALEYFKLAAENDQRNLNFGADLHRAVALLTPNASAVEQQQATSFIEAVSGGLLPFEDGRAPGAVLVSAPSGNGLRLSCSRRRVPVGSGWRQGTPRSRRQTGCIRSASGYGEDHAGIHAEIGRHAEETVRGRVCTVVSA